MRDVPLERSPERFRALGHALVDQLADFLTTLPSRPVSPAVHDAARFRALLGGGGLPENGADPQQLLREVVSLLADHSTFNGHPAFMAYITAPAAPIGALGDLAAAMLNPNCGSWSLSPIATLIEEQAVRWLADLLGYPTPCGGLLLSGGTLANMVGFWAGRAARAGFDVRAGGVRSGPPLIAYASAETHTWIQKAADLSGLGTDAIRYVPTDSRLRMDVAALQSLVQQDRDKGYLPFLVVGTAGTVSTGAVDPLADIGAFCREQHLWFHVDGAYGAPAVIVPGAPADLRAMAEADSIAVDPHKWLYAPLEAGCTLVRDNEALRAAFAYTPPYYHFESAEPDRPPNYYELGLQNSRGFRALKVWLALRHAGRQGYIRMIADDIDLARQLFDMLAAEPEIEAVSNDLSITTFRYIPPGVDRDDAAQTESLNELNSALLDRLQHSEKVYLSNAVVNGRFLLRACIVNFRTDREQLVLLRDLTLEYGRELAAG
jgi:aromatic-L-amino-acid/L-tryptophan decarboxylase